LLKEAMHQPDLFDALPPAPEVPPDQTARDFAVDPRQDVVLEASAGTGKTRVLVDRYVRLIQEGIDPRHILAVTFTRKAAAEMRDRALLELGRRAERGELAAEIWQGLRARVSDIQISTIDAFCFGLLREFPLEADVDPAFEIADETEMARFANEALDLTFRAARGLIVDDETVRLLFARVKGPVLRDALSTLLDRRQVALPAVAGFVKRHAGSPTAVSAGEAFVARLRGLFDDSPHRAAILDDGPRRSPEFEWLRADLTGLATFAAGDPARVQALRRRLERHFLRADLGPRVRLAKKLTAGLFASPDARKRHERAVGALAPGIVAALEALDADLNGLLARGLLRVLVVAVQAYELLLEEHAVLDFAGMLGKAVALLERQEEFARSRLKLQARYHHVLVDEFQDTSRLQWRLVELLIRAWGEGEGASDAPTSIFIVGDRKQSIYRFRHAEATLLDEAAAHISALRSGRTVRRAISHSYRAVPELLAFINALAEQVQSGSTLDDRFRYDADDRFPVPPAAMGALRDGEPVVGLIAEGSTAAAARAVASEIERLLGSAMVRTRDGVSRQARPDDIAILFRARTGHQYFEEALAARGIQTYVYKGLGFFDAPEVQDLQAMIRYLARPESDLRAAEFLRSRLVRISDEAFAALAPDFARALRASDFDATAVALDPLDRALLEQARASVAVWLPLADRLPPSELIDRLLREGAYAFEMRGRRLDQARENVKKVRGLVRRVESRGYATLGRLADYFETLRAGEESNAIVAASGCVNLMTIHAAKGLEFPIVFVVNMHVAGRGRPGGMSVIDRGPDGEPDVAFTSTDATRFDDLREAEELRRLLYVAVTRARDRLYLAMEVDSQGRLRRGGRSLAGLLPGTFVPVVTTAATSGDPTADWDTPNGRFTLRVCRPADVSEMAAPSDLPAHASPASPTPDAAAALARIDVRPLAFAGRTPFGVTEQRAHGSSLVRGHGSTETRNHGPREPSEGRPSGPPAGPALRQAQGTASLPSGERPTSVRHETSPRTLLGTLVHRLLQRRIDPALADADVQSIAARLCRAEELTDVADPRALAAEAVARYRAVLARGELPALLASGEVHHEVPYSSFPADRPGEVVRGVIDCLVRAPDGRVTVIEFKTGVPRQSHDAQAAAYAEALGAIWPDLPVQVRILYP
jgi:ATP-dependent helicase/nuclease subunit A